jgi:glycosyltransferase involved in cell wall biosynthesis
VRPEPLVSIITPSFNQGRFLTATIRSVIEQDYPNIEYIVMDGGSTDDSVAVLQSFSDRIDYWESRPDRGQSHAINKGLQRARGEVLGWLNSDDVLLPDTVSQVVETFLKNPEADVVYGRLERIDEEGCFVPTPLLPKDKLEYSTKYLLKECLVNQPGAFWRREIMEKVGFLNEDLQYSLDYEYWIRFALYGARFKRMDRVVARFRLSGDSKTVGQTSAQARELLQTFESVASRSDLADRLNLSEEKIRSIASSTRARICLQAFYGELKQRKWDKSWPWLKKALQNDPLSIFDRRWFDLGFASLKRRLGRWDIISRKLEVDQSENKNCPPN